MEIEICVTHVRTRTAEHIQHPEINIRHKDRKQRIRNERVTQRKSEGIKGKGR